MNQAEWPNCRSFDLADVDWIVVTSPNGAGRVGPLLAPDATAPQVAAVGSTTAAALPRCDLVAGTQSAARIARGLPIRPRSRRRRASSRCRADDGPRAAREGMERRSRSVRIERFRRHRPPTSSALRSPPTRCCSPAARRPGRGSMCSARERHPLWSRSASRLLQPPSERDSRSPQFLPIIRCTGCWSP